MLFDLRGRHRRRAVKVIYVGLAVLMGGGLVFFGVGGNVSGGLFDAFKDSNGNVSDQTQKRRDAAVKAADTHPTDARLWANVARVEYQLAGQSKGYDPNTGQFSGEARKHLVAAKGAWERHLKLAEDKPDADLAATMKNALAALGDMAGAVRSQEIVLDARGKSAGYGDYAQLAQLAYAAGQARKGDLAAQKAVELAPKDQQKQLKASLDSLKAQAAGGGTSTPGAPAPSG